jgi:hypothetical protein
LTVLREASGELATRFGRQFAYAPDIRQLSSTPHAEYLRGAKMAMVITTCSWLTIAAA